LSAFFKTRTLVLWYNAIFAFSPVVTAGNTEITILEKALRGDANTARWL